MYSYQFFSLGIHYSVVAVILESVINYVLCTVYYVTATCTVLERTCM